MELVRPCFKRPRPLCALFCRMAVGGPVPLVPRPPESPSLLVDLRAPFADRIAPLWFPSHFLVSLFAGPSNHFYDGLRRLLAMWRLVKVSSQVSMVPTDAIVHDPFKIFTRRQGVGHSQIII